MTQWRVDTSWYCPGLGCKNLRDGDDRKHTRHFIAKVRMFPTEDRASRWVLRARQEPPGFSSQANAEEVDIYGPYPVGSDKPPREPTSPEPRA